MLGVLLNIVCYFSFGYVCYSIGRDDGFTSGVKHAISYLFDCEEDYRRYLDYRRTGGNEAIMLQRLQNCLHNDFGMVAEWDGLRKVWTIEVDHEG